MSILGDIMRVDPPINFTTDDAMNNLYYYEMPGSKDGLLIDTRVWDRKSVHVWLPMIGSWCSFTMECGMR